MLSGNIFLYGYTYGTTTTQSLYIPVQQRQNDYRKSTESRKSPAKTSDKLLFIRIDCGTILLKG
jgi:hypothetical protein